MPGVVGSAKTVSPSRGNLHVASLQEASTSQTLNMQRAEKQVT